MKKVLHLLASGTLGGIENLVYNSSGLSSHQNVYVFFWNDGYYADKLINENRIVYCLKSYHSNYSKLKKTLEIIKKEKVDVVISHHSSPIFKMMIALLKLKYKKVSTICYAHANAVDICIPGKPKGFALRKAIHKLGFRSCDNILAISDSVKNSLITFFGVSEEKVSVLYNGISLEKFHDTNKEISQNARLIYVGRLIKEKGVQKTIKALSLMSSDVDYTFTIVGDGPYRSELVKTVEENNMQEKIFFAGPQKDVMKYLSSADIFIHLPNWEEGFGISLIEAMASGLLCVCNSKGALPEIVKNGFNGLLVEDSSNDVLSTEFENIINNYRENKYQLIIETAKNDVKKYSIEKYTKLLDEHIDLVYNERKQK